MLEFIHILTLINAVMSILTLTMALVLVCHGWTILLNI